MLRFSSLPRVFHPNDELSLMMATVCEYVSEWRFDKMRRKSFLLKFYFDVRLKKHTRCERSCQMFGGC